MRKITLMLAAAAFGLSANAAVGDVVASADSAQAWMDTVTCANPGVEAVVENDAWPVRLAYSGGNWLIDGDSSGAMIYGDGEMLASLTGEGVWEWTPGAAGLHTLTHLANGVPFNRTFKVEGIVSSASSAAISMDTRVGDGESIAVKAGEYFKATLAELGYDVPADGTAYKVVAKGLPAGLDLKYNAAVTKKDKKGKKVVVKPAKCEWWIEGVPTAELDHATNPAYLVITANGKTETCSFPIKVLAQDVTELGTFPIGNVWDTQSPLYLPGVTNGWTVSGLPTGLKYTAKAIKKVAAANTVYGKATKAGLFTITAKKKVGGYYETRKYCVLVTPKVADTAIFGDLTNITTTAYVPFLWDLTADVSAAGGNVAKVAGLPAGMFFMGQIIAGKPTKAGTYVVTFTKNVKSGTKTAAKTAQILWTVVENDAEVELGFNKNGGVIESGVVGLNYGELLAFTATDGATVTASGLPKGMKLVDFGGGNWGFSGFTTKTGTYLVTVKATLKGKTFTQRVALKVDGLPAWAKGTFNGYVWGTGNGEGGTAGTNGLATVSVKSDGKISGKFSENGTNWTVCAACYTGNGEWGTGIGEQAMAFTCSNVVATYSYKVKSGKKTVKKTLTRSFVLTVEEAGTRDACPYRGVARLEEAARSPSGPYQSAAEIKAWQNLWGSTYKAVGKKLFTTKSGKKTLAYKTFTVDVYTNDVGEAVFIQKGDEGDKTGLTCFVSLSLKVTTAGAVTATLTYDTGKKDKKTKKVVYYKPTCSTVVIPTSAVDAETFTGEVPLYFAPSPKNNFPGFAGAVPL